MFGSGGSFDRVFRVYGLRFLTVSKGLRIGFCGVRRGFRIIMGFRPPDFRGLVALLRFPFQGSFKLLKEIHKDLGLRV